MNEPEKRAEMRRAFERIYLDRFVVDKLNQTTELKTTKRKKTRAAQG